MPKGMTALLDILSLPGRWLSWLTLPLIAAILLAIVWAWLGRNTLLAWSSPVPVFGRALTVNGLFDLQWYIFALIVLFGGIWALRDNQHVAVDFLSLMLSERQRMIIRVLGDLCFLVPFCLIITYYGWFFALVAWTSGEGSTQGGLQSRWIIKAMLPLAFGLLALTGLVRAVGTAIALFRGPSRGR